MNFKAYSTTKGHRHTVRPGPPCAELQAQAQDGVVFPGAEE